jgi:hypothetical protein
MTGSKLRRARAANRHKNRQHALEGMDEMNELEFEQQFRMPRERFNELQHLIKRDITRNKEMARRSSGSEVCSKTRLAIVLRFLVVGSYLDIAALYGISQSNFFNSKHGVLWTTLEALDKHLPVEFSLNDDELKKKFAKICGVRGQGGNVMPGCVQAIDGWVMMTRCPTKKEVGTHAIKSYRNRKEYWALVIMGGCDANLKFGLFSAMSSGSTHDSIALEFTSFKQKVLDGKMLPPQYYTVGDEAFKCTDQLLVPWSGTGLGPWKDSFNYHLSSMRQCIERAFGVLTKRWGIFWRPLQCRFDTWSTIAIVCAKLHNWCIDKGILLYERAAKDRQEGDEWNTIDNDSTPADGQEAMDRRPSGERRRVFTDRFEQEGIKRPNFAEHNSRSS